jgi:hypothetical protein
MGRLLAYRNMVHHVACGDLSICGLPPFPPLQTRVRPFSIPLHLHFLTVFLAGSVGDLANYKTQPDWKRLTILLLWYLAGLPIAYMMQDSCSVGAPGTWARAFRVIIEGIVAFGLGSIIYVGINQCFPNAFRHLRYAGIGSMSIPNAYTSGIITVSSRKATICSLRWSCRICIIAKRVYVCGGVMS